MDHKYPLVSWNLFGFDIVFILSSILMILVTAFLVVLLAIICSRNLKKRPTCKQKF
ncbi:F0F1 ATP synthase subunit A, partial [Staphylococcus aureus]|nr:F0F1 ATP synthase subunit A [Staphylococcus aureus]